MPDRQPHARKRSTRVAAEAGAGAAVAARRRSRRPPPDATDGHLSEWLDLAEAKRLLDASGEDVIRTWAEWGLLRSRTRPTGELHVLRTDVLYRKAEQEGLEAIGGEELTPEELDQLEAARPGIAPWKRPGTLPSS